ncbi:unnamed protein product [Rotaria sordida]|uniref:Uncharacterized protein n=1 Tax=Rotaria sordida TaxID=392033 RepID=A0A816AEW8_9BILA|nr:unnamed protein product [Rotaria sordida]CAF1594725.1 unnamed protein product [Rotaria sordida]
MHDFLHALLFVDSNEFEKFENYGHINITDKEYDLLDLCRIAIDQSNILLWSNFHETHRMTSHHIWPPNHKLIMECIIDAHIVAIYYDTYETNSQRQVEEYENDNTTYCLISQLGNHPTDVKFVRGTKALREEILQRFQHPFQISSTPTQEQIDLFRQKSQTLPLQEFCAYATSKNWYQIDDHSLYGVLVDFIIARKPLSSNE